MELGWSIPQVLHDVALPLLKMWSVGVFLSSLDHNGIFFSGWIECTLHCFLSLLFLFQGPYAFTLRMNFSLYMGLIMNKNEVLEKEKEMWLWLYHVYVHSGQMKAITQSCYFSNYKTRIYNDLKANLIRNTRATCSGKGFNERIENWDWHSVSWIFLQGGFYFVAFRDLKLWLI